MPSGGLNKVNLLGKRFGKLIVEEESGSSPRGLALWKCLCDCGETCIISGYYLTQGRRKSCGCTNFRKRGKENSRWTGHEEISGSYWNAIKAGAKTRNLEMGITIECAWDKFSEQNGKCALSGMDIYLCPSSGYQRADIDRQTASLDRIDNNLGYIESNIQWVHKDINRIKMDLPVKYFVYFCSMVAQHAKLPEFKISDVDVIFEIKEILNNVGI
jgi:hypothetical protein